MPANKKSKNYLRAKRMYAEGVQQKDIAGEVGVTPKCISEWKMAANVTLPDGTETNDWQEAKEEYQREYKSTEEMAREAAHAQIRYVHSKRPEEITPGDWDICVKAVNTLKKLESPFDTRVAALFTMREYMAHIEEKYPELFRKIHVTLPGFFSRMEAMKL